MASPSFTVCDDLVDPLLAHLIGARVDAAHFVPETGLVVLSLYHKRHVLLGVGIGPIVAGIGTLPRLPLGRAPHDHPLVAAMRAHLVGARIRTCMYEDDQLWMTTAPHEESTDLPARLALEPRLHGAARLMTPAGATVSWPVHPRTILGPPTKNAPNVGSLGMDAIGTELVDRSDSYRIETYRRELGSILRKQTDRLHRRAAAVKSDLARLDDVPRLQKIGSLLLVQGKTIPRGARHAKLIDWDTNERVEVPLSPDKPAQEQAAAFFLKARRLQRGAAIMHQRLDDTEQAIAALKPLQNALSDASADWNALQELARRMHLAGLSVSMPTPVAPAKPRGQDERKPYHTFRSTNGRDIWVGRSGRDNDELVTRVARPHDLWLHAKNVPGAHVVVPLQKKQSCPADLLVDAATLAAHFSDARNETVTEVSYVERRFVRKPKKSAPGTVTTHHEKIIAVRIEKERLARLLRSKLET